MFTWSTERGARDRELCRPVVWELVPVEAITYVSIHSACGEHQARGQEASITNRDGICQVDQEGSCAALLKRAVQ